MGMMGRTLALAGLLVTSLAVNASAGPSRVALVIGNGAYKKVARLPNPVSDANAMAALLGKAGFEVVQVKTDVDVSSMRRALRDFTDAVRDADVAVVFYAGHGIEVGGTNYLIPVDAVLERDIDIEDEAVSLDRVSQLIEPAKKLRLIILDACRDNPFAGMKRTMAGRSIGRGLARVDILTSDTLVAFSAKAGSTAADGNGPNSPYTAALLQHLMTPGLDLRLALGRVRDQVRATSGGKQEPFVYGSLGGAEISLAPSSESRPPPATTGPAAAAPVTAAPKTAVAAPPVNPNVSPPASSTGEAERAWAAAKDTSSPAVLQAFVKRYGKTIYGEMANARLKELQAGAPKEQAALGSSHAAPAEPAIRTFQNPILNGQRVDYCMYPFMRRCGEPAALAWCQRNGLSSAISYKTEKWPTAVRLGDGSTDCPGFLGGCDVFTLVICK
jgi:uncharacterized caspase-like protein